MFNMLKHPGTGLPAVRFGLITTPIKASGGLPTLAGGVAKLPAAYHQSVVRMKNWLTSELTTLRTKCPQSKVVITGYSQGAQVAGDVYQSGIWPNVLVVVLYGDPYYNHNDTSDRFGMNVASKRPTTTHDGALGTRPAFNDWHVLTFCHQGDPVCQGLGQLPRYGFTQHNNYANLNDTAPAAGWVFSRIPPS